MKKKNIVIICIVVIVCALAAVFAFLSVGRAGGEKGFEAVVNRVEDGIAYATVTYDSAGFFSKKLPDSIMFEIAELDTEIKANDTIYGNYLKGTISGQTVRVISVVVTGTNPTASSEPQTTGQQGAQTGQSQSARLLSVDVKVIEVVNDTTFTVEALADCSGKINTGDTISVTTDFERVADIFGNYQESNHFKIYFPNVGETDGSLSVTCFDAVQYDADGECLELSDIEPTE